MSYCIGFICHYTLDKICHPYINEKAKTSVQHQNLESALDYELMQEVKRFKGRHHVLPKSDYDVHSIQQFYQKWNDQQCRSAINTMRQLNFFMNSRKLIQVVDQLAKKNGSFSSLTLNRNHEYKTESKYLVELVKNSVNEGVNNCQKYFHEQVLESGILNFEGE